MALVPTFYSPVGVLPPFRRAGPRVIMASEPGPAVSASGAPPGRVS